MKKEIKMAKQKEAAPKAAAAKSTINRKRRNALERRSLPKALKRQFHGMEKSVFKAVLAAWKESRKKPTPVAA